jgi:hypothetical protein
VGEALSAYILIDRCHALMRGEDLPERTSGAALFADISGFTSLTEALVRTLGARRGAEELTRQLNLVYNALIAEVERYGGSVISFNGDAITCWFDESVVIRPLSVAAGLTPGIPTRAFTPGEDTGQRTTDNGQAYCARSLAHWRCMAR